MESEENNSQQPESESGELNGKILKVAEPSIAYGKQQYSYADYLTWEDDTMREILNGSYITLLP